MSAAYALLLVGFGLATVARIVHAQNCPRPDGGPHMHLIGSNTFPVADGTKVTFRCVIGYTAEGGSASVTCNKGDWTALRLRCIRKNCGSAGEVEHGQINYDEGTEFGDKITITCDTGYELVGRSEITCGNQGWLDRLPICQVVVCSPPASIGNGYFTPANEHYEYSEVVQYSCQRDYVLNGSKELTCKENRQFEPGPPSCVYVQCNNPVINNGQWASGFRPPYKHKSSVTLRCNLGHYMIGSGTVTCGLNSQWAPPLPECKIKNCGSPGEVTNGMINYDKGTEFGAKITITCDYGYVLIGRSEITCGDKGWLDRLPTCEEIVCRVPEVKDGEVEGWSQPSYKYLDSVTFKCKPRFEMKGESTLTCRKNSQWSPAPPLCTRKNCGSPGEVENGQINYDEGTEFGAKVTITCDTGYELVGRSEITCGDQGWLDRLPTCEVVVCPPPALIGNGYFTPVKEHYEYLEVVQYSCQEDYVLNGSKEFTCKENRQFEPGPPSCVYVQCNSPVINNGQWASSSRPPYKHMSSVTLRCNPGHNMNGSGTVTCDINSQWAPPLPECKQKNCDSAGEVTNGHINYDEGTEFGAKITITCDPGYILVGESKITCGDQGWLDRLPKCEVVVCPPPALIGNGSFTPVKKHYEYLEVVQYSCQGDYVLNGSKELTCKENRQFEPGPPTCVYVQCNNPDINNGQWVSGSRPPYKHMSSVILRCNPGHNMNGSGTVTCGLNSQWSPPLPECKPIVCMVPEVKDGEAVDGAQPSYKYLESVTFICKPGFEMKGESTLTCRENSQWSPAPPLCTRFK